MSHEDTLPEELVELERSLFQLEPASSRTDRDRLMFAAGAASKSRHARRRIPAWPIATAASVLAASVFATLYANECRRATNTIREIVYVDRPVAPSPAVAATEDDTPADMKVADARIGESRQSVHPVPVIRLSKYNLKSSNYLHFQQIALTLGVEALPRREFTGPIGPPPAPRTAGELLNELLPAASAYSWEPRNG